VNRKLRKYTQDNKYKILSKSAWFLDDVIKTFGVFWVRSSSSCSLTKHEH